MSSIRAFLHRIFHRHFWTYDDVGDRCCIDCGKIQRQVFIEHAGERRMIGYR